jgi:integrase family protein with SAM-like domain
MTPPQPLGPVLHSFFASHLITVKGLRPASVRSYRDTVRLFLVFIAADKGCKITRLVLTDLTFDRVVAFLRHLEHDRGNHPGTRNQRLAALHCLFDYIAGRAPEMLATCQQVAAIPVKRTAPAGNPVPRTRRGRRPSAPPAPPRPARTAGPCPDPVPLQHRRPRPRSRRPARRAPRPRRPPAGAAARQRRQMAHLPALATDSTAAHHPARPGRAANARRTGIRRPRAAPDPLRHLQDHPPARSPLRRPPHRTADQPAHLPAHRRRPPARIRRRSQRDPRLARTRRPGHHQPLRRNQHQDQAGSPASRRTAQCSGGIPD